MEFARLEIESFSYTIPTCNDIDESKREIDLEQKLRDMLKLSGAEEEAGDDVEETEKDEPQVKQVQKLVYLDGSEYSGSICAKTSKREGYGTLKRVKAGCKDTRFIFVGQWSNDKFGDGPGELVLYADGGNTELLQYKGSFKNNKLNSYGTLKISGDVYEGHFEDSQRSGTGRLVCPGWSYEGLW